MSVEPEYIGIDHPFTFSCNPGVGCFNMCCSDVNQFLYPYDIIRLKNGLGMSSGEFLDTYTVLYSGDTTGLPIVSFKTRPENGNACPFVTDKGCGVYENRPASCRTFPLARAISRSRQTGEITEHFALIKDPVCQGFNENKTVTPREWMKDQGLEPYNLNNDKMIGLISLKQQIMPGPLPEPFKEKFILACYDIDRFAAMIRSGEVTIPESAGKPDIDAVLGDDECLLDAALAWIGSEFFGSRFQP